MDVEDVYYGCIVGPVLLIGVFLGVWFILDLLFSVTIYW